MSQCCDSPLHEMVESVPHGDGTADITIRCGSCAVEWLLKNAYPKSMNFDVQHDNESDLPVGASENKMIGTITYSTKSELRDEVECEVHRWLLEVHGDEFDARRVKREP